FFTASTNNGNDVTVTGVSVGNNFATTSPQTNNTTYAGGVNAFVVNGGLVGVGTDVLTSGGVSIVSHNNPQQSTFDSQIFAEGTARTIKAMNFAELGNSAVGQPGTANYRLGGRREFGDTNQITISQSQLALTPFPQTRV